MFAGVKIAGEKWTGTRVVDKAIGDRQIHSINLRSLHSGADITVAGVEQSHRAMGKVSAPALLRYRRGFAIEFVGQISHFELIRVTYASREVYD